MIRLANEVNHSPVSNVYAEGMERLLAFYEDAVPGSSTAELFTRQGVPRAPVKLTKDIFDQEDREINGFNDITGYEDFAVTRRIEDIEDLPEEISSCWNEVLVLCSNMSLLRECQRVVNEI